MLTYILRRLLLLIPVLLGITLLVFFALSLAADPTGVILGQHATPEKMEELRKMLGLNQPLYVQYFRFLSHAVRGDLGSSWLTRVPVTEEVLTRFPHTIELTFISILLAVLFGVTVGVISAVKQYSLFDHASMVAALAGVSMPIFWLGLMLIALFSVKLKLLPVSGRIDLTLGIDDRTNFYLFESLLRGNWAGFRSALEHLVLPSIALAAYSTALIARMTRSSMLEVLKQDYVQTARAKGLSERVVVYSHALRNTLLPVITIVGLQFGTLLGGAVLTESVFSWPGIGRLLVDSIFARDYPLVQGIVLTFSTMFIFVNLAVDVLYAYVDPRIRFD